MTVPVIDVHTHFFPLGLPDLARRTGDGRWPSLVASTGDGLGAGGGGEIRCGDTLFRRVDRRCFDLAARLADMDATSIEQQVLSPVPITLCSWADPTLASTFVRAQNEATAEAIRSCAAPSRFQWMGSVTLQDPRQAIADLEYGLGLGMCAVEIGTEVGGRELDDPDLAPFWDAANQLGVAVFIHPTAGGGAIRRGGNPYEFALGMLTDTATAATALVFGGVLDAYPDLRVGLAHGCGTFPWALPRLIRGSTVGSGEPSAAAVERITHVVSRLWADTLVFDPDLLPLLIERFGADHLMLGSDTPFYPSDWGLPADVLSKAVERGLCSDDERCAMLGSNALQFLGQHGQTSPGS